MSESFCYVYIIIAEDAPAKPNCDVFKVGISANPWNRLATFATSSPYYLTLLRAWRLPDRAFAEAVERRFHNDHAAYRMNGEWFHTIINGSILVYDIIYQWVEKVGNDLSTLEDFLVYTGETREAARDYRLAVYGDEAAA